MDEYICRIWRTRDFVSYRNRRRLGCVDILCVVSGTFMISPKSSYYSVFVMTDAHVGLNNLSSAVIKSAFHAKSNSQARVSLLGCTR